MLNTKPIVLLCDFAPHPLTDALVVGGYRVFEALAVSEVFNLVGSWPNAHIVVTHDVESRAAQIVRQHFITLQLKQSAAIEDVLWELSHFEPPYCPIE